MEVEAPRAEAAAVEAEEAEEAHQEERRSLSRWVVDKFGLDAARKLTVLHCVGEDEINLQRGERGQTSRHATDV